jgi:L-asparagine transporter-like permease
MAAASAISRLIVYVMTCASQVRLRSPKFAGAVQPASFVLPGGAIIPALAILIAVLILVFAATTERVIGGSVLIAVGAILFFIAPRSSHATTPS